MSKGFSVFANYGFGKGMTDTDCIFGSIGSCFPADSYDTSIEYSRVSFIPSGNFFMGGTLVLPKLKLTLNPFIVMSMGRPFNIVTGRDTNGDGLFTERPAFATEATDPADLRRTKFGDFDLAPDPGQPVIPRNYGLGPRFFSVNLGISRSFSFGNLPIPAAAPSQANAAPATAPASGSAASAAKPADNKGPNKPADSKTPAQGNAASSGPKPEKRYTMTFSVNIQNLLNTTNLSQPIGNLSSTRFGESTSTAGSFGFGPGGSAAVGNRRIQLQLRFSF